MYAEYAANIIILLRARARGLIWRSCEQLPLLRPLLRRAQRACSYAKAFCVVRNGTPPPPPVTDILCSYSCYLIVNRQIARCLSSTSSITNCNHTKLQSPSAYYAMSVSSSHHSHSHWRLADDWFKCLTNSATNGQQYNNCRLRRQTTLSQLNYPSLRCQRVAPLHHHHHHPLLRNAQSHRTHRTASTTHSPFNCAGASHERAPLQMNMRLFAANENSISAAGDVGHKPIAPSGRVAHPRHIIYMMHTRTSVRFCVNYAIIAAVSVGGVGPRELAQQEIRRYFRVSRARRNESSRVPRPANKMRRRRRPHYSAINNFLNNRRLALSLCARARASVSVCIYMHSTQCERGSTHTHACVCEQIRPRSVSPANGALILRA